LQEPHQALEGLVVPEPSDFRQVLLGAPETK